MGANAGIEDASIASSARISERARLSAASIRVDADAVVGDDVRITAPRIHIGRGTRIEAGTIVEITDPLGVFVFGDQGRLGDRCKILCGSFQAGDYVTIHRDLLCNGDRTLRIGSCVWVGQNCVLNTTDHLTIGNGVGIGTYSAVWTHGAHGEQLEGCAINKVGPVTIEDDVWILGAFNVISPGVRLGAQCLVMTGSVVTRDVPRNSTVAGNPARDISEKVRAYVTLSEAEKWAMLGQYVEDFAESRRGRRVGQHKRAWTVQWGAAEATVAIRDSIDQTTCDESGPGLIIVRNELEARPAAGTSVFSLATKEYTKQGTPWEVDFMRYLLYSKARFYPALDAPKS